MSDNTNTAVAEANEATENTNEIIAETAEAPETTETTETTEVSKPISKRRYTRGRSKANEEDFFLNGIYHAGDFRNPSALLKAMERCSDTPHEITQIMRHMIAPRNHDNYLPFKEAVENVMGEVDPKTLPNIRAQVIQACFNFVRDLFHGHDWEMYRIEREDAGLPVGGRYRTRRSAEYREWENSMNEARRDFRAALGASEKGRLSEELTSAFDAKMNAWLEENPEPSED